MIFTPAAIAERKRRVAQNLQDVLKESDVVLVFSGEPIQKPGGHDQTYPFLPHPDYFWISGSRRPYGVTTFSANEGWIDFVLPVTREEKIWEGGGEVIPGRDVKEFESWKSQVRGRMFVLGQPPKNFSAPAISEEEGALVEERFHEMRRLKDEEEVELISRLAQMASTGYQHLKKVIAPGMTEREIQIEYETQVFRAGAHKMPYDSIVGTGTNSAVLHAIPTLRKVQAHEMVLIDAGADQHDYCVDITRVFPASGSFSEQQKMLYQLVKSAQEKCIELCRPGTEWRDIHLTAGKVMAQGLQEMGILRISADEALSTGAISVFFPHGVGHMVGLRVRDVGGPPNPHPKKYGGSRVRVDMPLKAQYLMTVEPGLYFIPALLEDAETRKNYKDHINWSEVEKWKELGGVRIEDDILITASGPRNLTGMVEK